LPDALNLDETAQCACSQSDEEYESLIDPSTSEPVTANVQTAVRERPFSISEIRTFHAVGGAPKLVGSGGNSSSRIGRLKSNAVGEHLPTANMVAVDEEVSRACREH
jgi:hypothetical protein